MTKLRTQLRLDTLGQIILKVVIYLIKNTYPPLLSVLTIGMELQKGNKKYSPFEMRKGSIFLSKINHHQNLHPRLHQSLLHHHPLQSHL